MKNTLLFLLLLLSKTALFAQEPLYVLYDPGCLKEYFYRLDGSKLYSDFNDYHLQINDSTKVVFTVMRVENNRQTVKQLPSKYFGCSNRNITAADIKAVNDAKKPAYLMEYTSTGYAQSIINEISVYTLTQEHLRYKTATYDMTYSFTGNYQGGDALGKPNDAVPVIYSGSPMVECKMGVSYRENWFSEKESSSDITFFSELGMYSKVANERSYQLMLVANTPIGEYLRNMCLTGATAFNPDYKKEVATIAANPWNTDANPATNNGGTVAPVAPTYEMPDIHVVQAKESLFDIANYYPNLTVEKLREWNNLQTDVLKKGQEIRLKPALGSETIVPEQPQVTPTPEGQVGDDGYYIVAQGDNLYKIAKVFGVTPKEIMIANNMTSQNLDLGQKLLIPGADGYTTKPEPSQPVTNPTTPVSNDPNVYVVTGSNESLYDIAATYGVTANDLINWNDLNSFQLTPGQKLKVVNPDSKAPTTPTVVTPVVETPKTEVKPTVPTVVPATPTAVPTGGGSDDYHFVEMGENLAGIAKQHGITLFNIMVWNNLTDTRIIAGQKLLIRDPATIKDSTPTTSNIPASGIYVVQDGDTYESVTARYSLEDADLIRWNELKNTELVPGQSLYVKDPATITFTPPAPVTPPTLAIKIPTTHKVQKAEGLFAIARKYGITIADLRRLNNLQPDSVIKEGQDLIVSESADVKPIEPVKPTTPEKQPEPTKVEDAKPVFHTVKKGEGLYGIARKYNTTPENIMKLNNMKNNVISEEQKLRVK